MLVSTNRVGKISKPPPRKLQGSASATALTDTAFLKTAATRQVTAGAAEFGSATIRCSPFDGIFVETENTDQRRY
jgi:hypothetical protein